MRIAKHRLWILLSATVTAVVLLVASITAAVAPEARLFGLFRTDTLAPGVHTLRIVARTQRGEQVNADTFFVVHDPTPPTSSSGSSSGPGTEGSPPDQPADSGPAENRRTVRLPGRLEGTATAVTLTVTGSPTVREAEQRSKVQGSKYSSARRRDGREHVIFLAGGNDEATIPLKVPSTDAHLVELKAKADFLGPVRGLLLVNGIPWRTFTTAVHGTGTYVWLPVGVLRAPPQTFAVRFLNDFFLCTQAQLRAGALERCDRNLSIDKIRLTPVAR